MKLTHVISISSDHVKISLNSKETCQERIAIFLEFLQEIWHAYGFNQQEKKGARSKKIQENLQKLKAHGSMAQTHGSDGSGSN